MKAYAPHTSFAVSASTHGYWGYDPRVGKRNGIRQRSTVHDFRGAARAEAREIIRSALREMHEESEQAAAELALLDVWEDDNPEYLDPWDEDGWESFEERADSFKGDWEVGIDWVDARDWRRSPYVDKLGDDLWKEHENAQVFEAMQVSLQDYV